MASKTSCLQTCSILFVVIFIFCKVVVSEDDYYSILGLNRNADTEEIRRAYRRLAKEWHPDKSTESDAQEKFIKINEAYEVLSDAKKREDYDRYGHSGPPTHHEQHFEFFQDSGFMFFDGMPHPFHSHRRPKDFITLNYYKKTILPDSYSKLYLLQIISDWCMSCAEVEDIWEQAARDLKFQGAGTGLVNRNVDPQLARLLGVKKFLPDFVAVISGKVYHYTGRISVQNLKDFVSGLFPKDLVPEVSDSSSKPFLTQWYENKPRALLFTTKTEAPLLLKIVAFKYQHHVGVGYVQLSKAGSQELRARFAAARYEPTFMIFKENISRPDVLLQASDLHTGTLDDTISSNLHLHFPRLSSQELFETLCPSEPFASMKSLCVVLFTDSTPNLQHSLPSMSKDMSWKSKRVRFVYLSPVKQRVFESSLKMNEKSRSICKNKLTSKKVAIVWRVKDRELKYTWYENGWCGPKDVDRLTETLNDLQDGEIELEMSAVVPDLHNEHAKNVAVQMFDLWHDVMYYCFHYINWSTHLPALSLVLTVAFVFIISCLFPSMTDKDATKCNESQSQPNPTPEVYGLVHLNPTSQENLIHRSPQGRLVLVLLTDATSSPEALRSPIVQMFARITSSYQKENIFTFAWLSIPEHIVWCNEVMKVQTFGEIRAGTVLALNGAKTYLSIFKIQKPPREQDAGNVFDDSEEDDSEGSTMVFREDKRTQKRTADELARQLPGWIEKLLEGMVPRVHLESWPQLECDK